MSTLDDDLIGTIIFSASPDHTPPNWLPCDGAPYLRSAYPKLFAVIHQTYGAGEPANETFRVPDMRGCIAVAAGGTNPELNKPTGSKVGSPDTPFDFASSGASDEVEMFGKNPPGDKEADTPFKYTSKGHTHQFQGSFKTLQPGIILRCLIKAK